MSKALWACTLCGEDFTRRSSAKRHRNNVHHGRCALVRFVEYLAGLASGHYSRPIDPPRLARRARPEFGETSNRDLQISTASNDRIIADSATDDFSSKLGIDAENYQSDNVPPYLQPSLNQSDNGRGDLLDEFIRFTQKILQVKTIGNQLFNYSIPLYQPLIHAPMSIPKVVGFRGVSCDTCMSSTADPILSFDRLDLAVKTDHTCSSQAISKLQNRINTSDFRKTSHEWIINYLLLIISSRVGSEPIFLAVEELQAPCSKLTLQYFAGRILPQYIFNKLPGPFYRQRLLSKEPCIDLGRVNDNHWARRANREPGRRTILKEEELLDFLNLTKSTFGAFQVELEDGMQHYLLLYINLP